MTVLNITSREYSPGVSVRSYRFIADNKKNGIVEGVDFLVNCLEKEVMCGSSRQQKKNIRKLKAIQIGFVSLLGVVAVMNPFTVSAQTPELWSPSITEGGITLTPDLVMDWGLKVALMTVAAGVALAGALLAVAGVYRMLRKRKEAEDWTTDIIKGLVQVLIAVPIVYTLFHLAQIVFRNMPVLDSLM